MKVALVHDYIKEYGGAEKVLEALHELFPEAPVFTSVYLPQYLGPHKERFENWDIRTSFLQLLPGKAKLISPFRLLSAQIFKSFDFSNFDVIITSSTGGYITNILNKKSAKLICYCHTPPRYLYGYATARKLSKNLLVRTFVGTANHILRLQDFQAAQNVDQYIANSKEVAARIQKFYRREAIVINPPVEVYSSLHEIEMKLNSGGKIKKYYFLTGGRLARAKHNEIPILACTQQKLPLKVFGKGFAGFEDELRKAAGSTVEFVGEVSEEEKWELMVGAQAFLYSSEDEDFGIIPVESMGAGTPVIAYRSGGVQETIVENETGLFFDHLTSESLTDAIRKFEQAKFSAEKCKRRAQKYNKQRFMQEIKRAVESVNKELKVSSANSS